MLKRNENVIPKTYLFKRTFDILFAILGCIFFVITLPLFCAILKYQSKSPIFFHQIRVGIKGTPFKCIKYRTIDSYASNTASTSKFFSFLRKSHLDEIPQFINVLKGDMSVVGPRPEWEKLARAYSRNIPNYNKRCLVKPGITGLAQIKYKAPTTPEEVGKKLLYDLTYINSMNFLLDFKIIFKTTLNLFKFLSKYSTK